MTARTPVPPAYGAALAAGQSDNRTRTVRVGWLADFMSDMWLPDDQDPRTQGNPQGEKATYVEYLANYRLTLGLKCDGLSPEQLATRSVPAEHDDACSGWCGTWRGSRTAGSSAWPRPAVQERIYWSAEDDDFDFNAVEPTQECVDDAFAAGAARSGRPRSGSPAYRSPTSGASSRSPVIRTPGS